MAQSIQEYLLQVGFTYDNIAQAFLREPSDNIPVEQITGRSVEYFQWKYPPFENKIFGLSLKYNINGRTVGPTEDDIADRYGVLRTICEKYKETDAIRYYLWLRDSEDSAYAPLQRVDILQTLERTLLEVGIEGTAKKLQGEVTTALWKGPPRVQLWLACRYIEKIGEM